MRTVGRVAVIAVVLGAAYLLVTLVQVALTARGDAAEPADAIVVLGAAQYDGKPSPALRDRLDHAVALFENGTAPVVWVTGGRQPGDRFTEASVASRYLISSGIPDDALQLEVQGGNSYESLAAAARYLRARDQREVVLISDPWHAYRITEIAREVGLLPRFSPADDPAVSGYAAKRLAYETLAVAVGRVTGYRRLTVIGERWASP